MKLQSFFNRSLFLKSVSALLLILTLGSCSSEKIPEKPNVLIVLLDTLRADHLGVYGYPRNTSPILDQFAKDNTFFQNAISAAPWTPASVASILTGLYPVSHGMMPPNDRSEAKTSSSTLSDNLVTLAEVFSSNGYKTGAITPNPWMSPEFGYNQGFDKYNYKLKARADIITNGAIDILNEVSANNSPFFMYVHYLDPHDPYDPPGKFADMFSGAENRGFEYPEKMKENIGKYDGEIAFTDREVGRLFDYLKSKDLWKDLIVIVVGDHGEQFMEQGDPTHGFKLYSSETHVPLMLKSYRKADRGRIVSNTVSTIDIAPTIIELAKVKDSTSRAGLSLTSDESLKNRPGVLSEIRRRYSQKSIVDNEGRKLILTIPLEEDSADFKTSLTRWKNPEIVGVFDRNKDSGERAPLQVDSVTYSKLRELFESEFAKAVKLHVESGGAKAAVSDETLEHLKSLGYLQ